MLSEEEIIYIVEKILSNKEIGLLEATDTFYQALQGLLDLYNKEKEKNKKYEEGTILSDKQTAMVIQAIKEGATEQITKEMENYIHKDKIRKIIETSTYPDFAIQKILELLEESE